MLLAQEVTQELLDGFVGKELIIENDGTLTRGTIARLQINGMMVDAVIENTSWKRGSLDDVTRGQWSATTAQKQPMLLSKTIESEQNGVIILEQTRRGTRALLRR